jgi:hypothetical protein
MALTAAIASLATACSGSFESGGDGLARVSIDGSSYDVSNVSIVVQAGRDPYFRIEGDPASNSNEDCVPGLESGLRLYGNLPPTVHGTADLAGRRFAIDFTGDGDDRNFCFAGMEGLAGAEEAWVTIESVNGDRVAFSMNGTFKIYDENGDGPVKTASGSGVAILRQES